MWTQIRFSFNPNRAVALGIFFILLCSSGCSTVPYSMDAPAQFKRYDDDDNFRFITADGVMLKAREVDNYPRASLHFWKDASREHLEKMGYVHNGTRCFKTRKGLDGCTLTFALPHGAEDWIFQETIFVVSQRLVLIEAAGEFAKFNAVAAALEKSLETFSPNL
jgi:hypothetical protein